MSDGLDTLEAIAACEQAMAALDAVLANDTIALALTVNRFCDVGVARECLRVAQEKLR